MKNTLFAIAFVAALVVAMTPTLAEASPPPGYCEVTVCNKLERFTLSPTNWVKDRVGEQCFPALVAQNEAQPGKILSSESRWWQGSSINPTKKSVTRVKTVHVCTKAK